MLQERPLAGGPLAIDLLNTSWQRDGEPVDWFDDDEAVVAFVHEYDVGLGEASIADARAALIDARVLIGRLLSLPAGAELPVDLVSDVDARLADAHVEVHRTAEGPEAAIISRPGGPPLAVEAIVDALDLRRLHGDRVRMCDHEACVLWFRDTSKAGRRRWCSMERCGNRVKARRHHATTLAAERNAR